MNVLIVSQCHKNALTRTRRILDQFAERRGDRTWQTAITRQGLDTLRLLLRKSARKNTAVACHWICGKDHSELLWIVGNAALFSSQGAVPTNTTERDVLRQKDEHDWHHLATIRLLTAMAALFHDLGKANQAFQKKLAGNKPVADALRHEWISLRLFEAFVGQDGDRRWLERLATLPQTPEMGWLKRLKTDGMGNPGSPHPLKKLPALAQVVGWLIVTHHRLPTNIKDGRNPPNPAMFQALPNPIVAKWCGSRINGENSEQPVSAEAIKDCWRFAHPLPLASRAWQGRVRKLAQRMLSHTSLFDASWLRDPFVMHISRLVLMLADHHYSSLTDPKKRVQGDPDFPLFANTRRDNGHFNQPLDEHLIGVERQSSLIAYTLPRLEKQLPRLARHKGFKQRSRDPRFRWQDKAYDLAVSLRHRSQEQGFFGINMASTGCGKTLANGRIMYALADPLRGARFSIALGLRTLTLQTGDAYRFRLGLGADVLAVRVGGPAVRELHESNREKKPTPGLTSPEDHGSESAEPLLPDTAYVHYEGSLEPGPLAAWLAHTRGAEALLNAPLLICTIDHLMPATEGTRGGHQIAPMLRLMSSDLVLDEPDDFGIEDLPALSRLVHWAGLLGSRVLLSSATLPPALVEGMFNAYRRGRSRYQQNRGVPGLPVTICCAWFDEHARDSGNHAGTETFIQQHLQWVRQRVKKLAGVEVRRRARMVSLLSESVVPTTDRPAQVAQQFHTLAHELHHQHHSVDAVTGKRVSFGLIRMANIGPLFDVTQALARLKTPPGHRLHLCCYHSQHPLLVRSSMEQRLDQWLNRQQPEAVFHYAAMRTTLNSYPEPDHLFVVLATPVAEVGRDHDYDWAIVEPSSMRSIIQLAGRVRRHRPGLCTSPNIYLLDTNMKSLRDGVGKPTYCHPGFESTYFPLDSHSLHDLLEEAQYAAITAIPRIAERETLHPRDNLVDLEHAHLRAKMVDDPKGRLLPVHHWWRSQAHLSGEMQRISPFRYDPMGRRLYAFLIDDNTDATVFTRIGPHGEPIPEGHLLHDVRFDLADGITLWGNMDYRQLLERLAEQQVLDLAQCARRFGTLELPARGVDQGWFYHPALGLRRHP